MIWNQENTQSGQVVASQTTQGDFKDIHILSGSSEHWFLVSLQDGYRADPVTKEQIIARLNEHRFVPISKVIGSTGVMPENRAGLPQVRITGLRHNP